MESNGNEQVPGDNQKMGAWASFTRRVQSFAAGMFGPALKQGQDPDTPGPITQAAQRGLKTLGLVPEGINYERLGQVMEQAVAAGLKDYASTLPDATRPGQPRHRGTRDLQYDPRKVPAMGVRGLVGLAGMAISGRLTTGGLGGGPTGGGGYGGGYGNGGGSSVGSAVGAATQAAQSQTTTPDVTAEEPTVDAAAQRATAWAAARAGAPVASTAQGALGEAAAAGGTRSMLGEALMGYSTGGLGGAWEGLAGASEGATRLLGPLGIAATVLSAINEGGNIIAGQRQIGATFQGILGGTNLQGQMQRVNQAGFRLSELGNLSSAQANALFQGVTGLDMTGAQRSNAMQQAVQMYDQLGVSIQTSIQLITTAATSGNRELAGLADAIKSVTQAAVAGQVNANVARATFGALTQAAVAGGIQGVPAQTLSKGMTNALSKLGPMFQNVDMSGLFGQQSMIMLANAVGMNPDQFQGQINQGNTAIFGRAFNQVLGQFGQGLNMRNNMTAAIAGLQNRSEARAIAAGKGTQADIQDLAYQMEANDPTGGLAYGAQQALAVMGINVDQTRALEIFAAAQYGSFKAQTTTPTAGRGALAARALTPPSAPTRAQALAPTTADLNKTLTQYVNSQTQLSREQRDTLLQEGRQAITQMSTTAGQRQPMAAGARGLYDQVRQQWQQQYLAAADPQNAAASAAVGMPSGLSQAWERLAGATSGNQAREWYMNNVVGKQQKRDPVMEMLLKRTDLNNAQTLFNVKVGGGQTVLATAEDLEKHYMKAVQTGQVTVAASQDPNMVGQTIAKLLGVQAQSGQYISGAGYAASKAGQAEQARLEKQKAAETKNIVTIQLGPNVQKYFNVNAQGNVNVANDSQTINGMGGLGYPAQIPG